MKTRTFYLAVLLIINFQCLQAQVLETEDSKPLLPGQFEVGVGLEFQTSQEVRCNQSLIFIPLTGS